MGYGKSIYVLDAIDWDGSFDQDLNPIHNNCIEIFIHKLNFKKEHPYVKLRSDNSLMHKGVDHNVYVLDPSYVPNFLKTSDYATAVLTALAESISPLYAIRELKQLSDGKITYAQYRKAFNKMAMHSETRDEWDTIALKYLTVSQMEKIN